MFRVMGPILSITVLALDLLALWFVIKSTLSAGWKAVWIILILVTLGVGAIAYFLIYGTGAPPADQTAHEQRGLEEQGFGK